MKKKLLLFLRIYLLFIAIFIVQKPLFMAYYHDLYRNDTLLDCLSAILHGFRLDASMAGYLTVIPGLLLIASVWVDKKYIKGISRVYYVFISCVISIIFVADIGLYKYWGFRLDSTPLFYLKSPKNAMASTDWLTITLGFTAILLIGFLLFYIFNRCIINSKLNEQPSKNKIIIALTVFLSTGLLFLPIRGGVTVSTMNVGQVYFSEKMELNHAAINPFFSLMESLTLEQDFDKQYRFMKAEEAEKLFAEIKDKPATESIPTLFTIERPNVILVVMESFMSKVIAPLGGLPNVAVRINGFCKEGILFTNFYANSFRTDRGLVSIISGYPAQPTTSIMKYPHKTQNLPSIPGSLKKAGYNLQYYYGGDADFTNMRSYLTSMGIENIISDKDFPLKDRMTKWGAPDHVVFNRISADLAGVQKEPFLKIFQTLSSHEPFEVPCHRLKQPYLNSVAYTDSCLGAFIDQFKKTKWWKNTVIILVPDHAMRYPATVDNRSVERHQIPLLMLGGAIQSPRIVDTYASQIDIAATLLGQLKINHDDFKFSKNILNPASPHFAYFTFPNGFGMLTSENRYIFDYDSQSTVLNDGKKDANKTKGEAFLQTLYNDLEKR